MGYISGHVVDARLYSLVVKSTGLGLESALLFQGVPAGKYAPPQSTYWEAHVLSQRNFASYTPPTPSDEAAIVTTMATKGKNVPIG